VRFAAVLREPWLPAAERAESLGFDAVWIDQSEAPAPLVVAASVASRTRGVRLLACVDAGPHPVALAEEAIMADLASNGRLVLVVRGDEPGLLAETVDVLHLAFAPRPFRHEGVRWRIPAGLPEHDVVGDRLRVTPAPAQLELPVWVAGAAGAEVAAARGMTFAAAEDERSPEDPRPGRRVRRYRAADVERLRAEWPDLAILDVPDAELVTVATHIRPRLQLDALPPGLEDYWEASLP